MFVQDSDTPITFSCSNVKGGWNLFFLFFGCDFIGGGSLDILWSCYKTKLIV